MKTRKELLEDTKERAYTTYEDLGFLREFLDAGRFDRARIRRTTPILRRLLIDRELVIVANPRAPRIKVPIQGNLIDGLRKRTVRHKGFFLQADISIEVGNFKARALGIFEGITLTEEEAVKLTKPAQPAEMHLDNWLNITPCYFHGEWFTRREILKYVANKRGGVHIDKMDTQKLEHFHRMCQSITIHENGAIEEHHPEDHFSTKRGGIDPALFVVLGTISALLDAKSIRSLISALELEFQ